MALAVAQVIGSATGTGASSVTVTFGSATSAGSLISLVGPCYNTAGVGAGTDFSDNKSNTYTLRDSLLSGATGTGIEAADNNGGTRGASHSVTFNGPGTADTSVIAGIEITGQDASTPYDTTTHATASDGTSPFSVTAAAAISGNQIAIYGVVIDTGGTSAWTPPTGYTVIGQLANGVSDLVHWVGYKINETGTPTVSASNADAVGGAGGKELFMTYKEAAGGGGAPLAVPLLRPNMRGSRLVAI